MQFRILGPLQVLAGGRPIEPGAPKQRALLAFLLINANQVVQADRILEELWPEEPPAGGLKTLQVHVSKLRKALTAGGTRGGSPLRTEGSGYVLDIESEDLDAVRFEQLWRRSRADLGTNPLRAATELRRALGLWRGPPLADFTYEPFAQPEIRRLDELRLVALEDAIDAELALGRQAEVLDRLRNLIEEYPLRERLRGQLMVALYRLGRQSEALRAFSDLRRLLGEELGIEPSPELCDLEDRILLHDAGLLLQVVPESRGRASNSPDQLRRQVEAGGGIPGIAVRTPPRHHHGGGRRREDFLGDRSSSRRFGVPSRRDMDGPDGVARRSAAGRAGSGGRSRTRPTIGR